MNKSLKLILTFLICISFSMNVSAQTVLSGQAVTTKELEKVTNIGQKILSANGLPTKVTFYVSEEDEVNAYANIDNEVHVYQGLIKLVETDDELAAVIAHEIGHIANKHMQKQTVLSVIAQVISDKITKPFASLIAKGVGGLSMLKVSRSAEYEADITGADLMIAGGYNPQGMLSFLNKISQNYIDVIQTHPSGEKRLKNIYDYVSFNYPEKLKTDYNTESYKKFKIYSDKIVFERNSDPKKMQAYVKEQTKLRNDRLKRAKTITSGTNKWESSYNIFKSAIGTSN